MTIQAGLLKDSPMILDATCSFNKSWPKYATIRMDIRPECNPDVVGDIRQTNFPDHYFDTVYVDPPHFIRKSEISASLTIKRKLSGRLSPTMFKRYGMFKTRSEWLDFLDKVNIELFRILKPTGRAYWKLTFGSTNEYVKESELTRLTNFEVIEHKITPSKGTWSTGKNSVHWLTMKPKLLQTATPKEKQDA